MKNKLLIIISLISFSPIGANAQLLSLKNNVSYLFPNTLGKNTRIVDFINNKALVFIDTPGNTYLLTSYTNTYFTPSSYYNMMKLTLPYRLSISDMERDYGHIRFGGSFDTIGALDTVGIYGMFSFNPTYTQCTFTMRKLPDMNNLKKISYADNLLGYLHKCIFAIGETFSGSSKKTHIVELQISGPGIHEYDPYIYASTDDKEHFDDLALIDTFIVYTTRDFRPAHSHVNLRLSDINNVLTGTQIDFQYRFQLNTDESVVGEVFITPLIGPEFEVCYIKFNNTTDKYFLCMHKIVLYDLLINSNTIISQELEIPKGEFIVDVKYDTTYQVLLLLLNKDEYSSVFLHALPYEISTYGAIRLESSYGEAYYSLDTIKSNPAISDHYYQAWGGNKSFVQSFSYNGTIQGSCLQSSKRKIFIVNPITVDCEKEPLERHNGNRIIKYEYEPLYSEAEENDCYINTVK